MRVVALLLTLGLGLASVAQADLARGQKALQDAQTLARSGDHFASARMAFQAVDEDKRLEADAYAWVALGLVKSGFYQSASYFFIKTLQSGNRNAMRRILGETPTLMLELEPDLLRSYLVKHTRIEDYDSNAKSALLLALGKQALLASKEAAAIHHLQQINPSHRLWPMALQLKGTAHAIRGEYESALSAFKSCVDNAESSGRATQIPDSVRRDLKDRCQAGEARTLYQMGRFRDSDFAYDLIAKQSFVWPDVLFEQAWNAFAQQEYNRSLGKLVTYKSPALAFVFNPEVDVLKAQSYLMLCLYSDANSVINEFNSKYAKVGESVKRFVESNSSNLAAFYRFGKEAARGSLYTPRDEYQMANRFVRGPSFQRLIAAERASERELARARSLVGGNTTQGFVGFLNQVLRWRVSAIQQLGGAFVKNSLIDYHGRLIADFEKIAFIKLEMLKRAKDQILKRPPVVEGRGRGNQEPERKRYQYYWSFNGEFWNDELGDYVFGLKSECGGNT